MPEKHELMGGKLHLYQRENSSHWQCSTYLDGKNHRISTKEENFTRAKDFAENWYMELYIKFKRGEVLTEKTFREGAVDFAREWPVITTGQRSPKYIKCQLLRLEKHIIPFIGDLGVSKITGGILQEYRVYRHETSMEKWKRPPAWATLHLEIVMIRLVLKHCYRKGWLKHLPDLSEPYRKSKKVTHRGWFNLDEYQKLYKATRQRAKQPKRESFRWACEQLHDLVLFVANTGLRPDEVALTQRQDVEIVFDEATQETILDIEVRGKRGVGYCKSTSGAVAPFKRLLKRNNPQPTDLLFPSLHRVLFNTILNEQGLKFDREGIRRTLYSLRHTYICFRLIEGANIYQLAKNCRTSVEMIQKFYAIHLKDMLDAAAINARRPRKAKRLPSAELSGDTAT